MAIWVFWVIGAVFTIGFVWLLSLMTSNFPVTPTRIIPHGRHWQSGTSLHSGSHYSSGFSTGGAGSFDPGEDDATAIIPIHPRPHAIIPLTSRSMMSHHAYNAPAYLGAGHSAAMAQAQAQANQVALYRQAMAQYMSLGGAAMAATGIVAPHPKTALKSEGIRAGEIIAWRAWRVEGDTLRSASSSSVWDAKEPMRGDAAAGFGVHAYKGPHGPMMDGYADHRQEGSWVIGEVALWGDIIEHERGYRAEFGRVHSLVTWSRAVPQTMRDRIQRKYLTEPQR